MKHLTPYCQNETSLSPVRGKGMVYRGGLMSEYSTEIFQVKVHQTCIIVLVFLCKETEFVTLVEPRCCSERIYCYKATTSSISMGKYVLHNSRGDRHLGYSRRHTQVPVPATTTRAVCPVVPAKTRFYNQSNAENNKKYLEFGRFSIK